MIARPPTQVMTVLGPISSRDLGVTLCHEHLYLDNERSWHGAEHPVARRFAEKPVAIEDLATLHDDPYLSLDNQRLTDVDLTIAELDPFTAAGGQTILDPTCRGMGHDPLAVRRISEESGVQVVLGCGYYLQRTHPPEVATSSVEELAARIEADVREGIDGSGVRPGFIGEIGVSPDFTADEEKCLRAAARAQARTLLPLSVHLPGWLRYGDWVLDVVEEEGGDPGATILCHQNPSHDDPDYQMRLAQRGSFLEYDMLGMPYLYPGEGQSPSDDQAAVAIRELIGAGFGAQILLSGDVFLKMMLTAFGGMGYAHVLERFVPRLRRHQVPERAITRMLVDNPRALFEAASKGVQA